MKIELRLPTQEQYAYIGLELADGEVLTDEMIHTAIDDYRRAMGQIKGNAGLSKEEFDQFIDRQLSGQSNHIEVFNKMSPEQQLIAQLIKRSKARIAYQIKKDNQ